MATITAIGTAVATVILSLAPLVQAWKAREPARELTAPAAVPVLHEAIITTLKDEMR